MGRVARGRPPPPIFGTGTHTKKRLKKRKKKRSRKKAGYIQEKVRLSCFCLEQRNVESLHKEEASHSLHSKSWLPNEIYFSLLLLPTRLHTDMEKNLSQPHLIIKRSRGWKRLRMCENVSQEHPRPSHCSHVAVYTDFARTRFILRFLC